jgi:hypothetical protein
MKIYRCKNKACRAEIGKLRAGRSGMSQLELPDGRKFETSVRVECPVCKRQQLYVAMRAETAKL